MMISTASHAAQAVLPGAEPRFYDDRGCLAEDARALPSGARLFVQQDGEGAWIAVDEAFFAFPTGHRTPMGRGVTAFRREDAAAKADSSGRAWRWSEVVDRIAAGTDGAQR